ncbi:DNA-binding protein [Candidatus Bathyarchaeota archaeon]|nr:MAG: DNA-binding protein [Candidatus Bathyarchaeota archaeon]RLI04247.1 MAG: DNA-binding protein [Candidatus Bathyarchaeota archaeon]
MSEDEELEALRRRRLMELQQQMLQEQQRAEAQRRLELQKQALMRRILTPKARQRLANLKMVRPEFASQLELQLIQIAQQGRISIPITDDQLKEILSRLQRPRREIRIRRV